MKKISIIVDSILAAAVIALFVLYFLDKQAAPAAEEAKVEQEAKLPIAYVNLDSVLLQYEFAIDANDKLMSKQEDARLKLNTKMNTLQREAADFQRKLEANAFLSRERAESEQRRLLNKQQELQDLEAKLTNEILQQNQDLNLQLADTLQNYLEELNKSGKYQIIFANAGKENILLSADGYDITREVIDGLNARYTK
jgi:outer membrane protein